MSNGISNAENSILVLHDPALDPRAFLTRLISPSQPLQKGPTASWRIANKYYTADVHFRLLELDRDTFHVEGVGAVVPVVLYLFTGKPPSPLPPAMTRLIVGSEPDISLAIRVLPPNIPFETKVDPSDKVEDTFAEMGMEFIDESGIPEEDDERPMDALEMVRQTIMTHMWAGMVRKPSSLHGFSTDGVVAHESEDGLGGEETAGEHEAEEGGEHEGAEAGPSRFPISFPSSVTHTDPDARSSAPEPSATSPTVSNPTGEKTVFPDMEELRSQLVSHQGAGYRMGDLEGPGRLGVMEQDSDLGLEDWERLDDWLDGEEGFVPLEDGEEDMDDMEGMDESEGVEGVEALDDRRPSFSQLPRGVRIDDGPVIEDPDEQDQDLTMSAVTLHLPADQSEKGFEDDFDDFAAFQSAPSPSASPSFHSAASAARPHRDDPYNPRKRNHAQSQSAPESLGVDPTPLLLHLQAVRAELAGMGDEDERRVRAGREVGRVMRDLGMGDDDLGELGELGDMDDLLGM